MVRHKFKPQYTLPELARMIGVDYDTLLWRLSNTKAKPESDYTAAGNKRNINYGRNGGARSAQRYEKDSFIAWHNREWIDSGRAYSKASEQ